MRLLSAFIKSITPDMSSRTVKEKISIIEQRIGTYIVPSIQRVGELDSFKSDYTKGFMRDPTMVILMRSAGRSSSEPVGLAKLLLTASENTGVLLRELLDKADRTLPKTIVLEGTDVPVALQLKLINAIDLYVEYTSRVLYHIAQHESEVKYTMTRADLAWLQTHLVSYMGVLTILLGDPKKILSGLASTPPVSLDSGLGRDSPEGLTRLEFIPIVTPLFHRFAVMRVNWELEREERLKLEKRGIESAIERHRQNSEGLHDARAEKIMENWRKELVLVNQKISNLED